ncbi:MAG: signal peptidase II [Actinomycetia bacterium]|nr:signal peptidase II [Actinomycetes bacterium]
MTEGEQAADVEAVASTAQRTVASKRLRLCLTLAAVIVVLDQVTKHWALNALSGEPPHHVVWTLQWNLTFNSGMAFSKGRDMGPIIGVLALAVAGFVVATVRKQPQKVVAVAAGFVLGGAIGNLIDRIFRGDAWLRGSVVDFIDFQWFPIFNIADIAVNVGGAIFVLWSLFAHAPDS